MSRVSQLIFCTQLLGYTLLQVVVAQYIVVPHTAFCFVYVGSLLSMPYRHARITTSLPIGFIVGLLADLFYDSLGMHAAACVLLIYSRPLLLKYILPTSTQETDFKPTWRNMGTKGFAIYAFLLILLHHAVLFGWDATSGTLLWVCAYKTILSTLLTYVAIGVVQGISVVSRSHKR